MPNLIVENKFSKIDGEDDIDFLNRLGKFLSFKYIGAEFTPAFKAHRWDGCEYLLSNKLVFMTGLLDKVISFYKMNEREINIIDKRQKFVPGKEIDISAGLKKLNLIPHDYQIAASELAAINCRTIFNHPTGSGKSLTAALIVAKLGKLTTVYVISKSLLHQFYEFFYELFGDRIGIIGDGICKVSEINIVSIQTAGRALGLKKKDVIVEDTSTEKFDENDTEKILSALKAAKIHIFDEAHICATVTIRKIYKIIDIEKIIGMSGTFCRDDGADLLLEGIVGNVSHDVSASELIKRNILAKPFIKFKYVKGYAHFKDSYPTVYSNHIVNNEYRNNIIISEAEILLEKGYQILILFKTIAHGKILKKMFDKKKIDCEFLTGTDKELVRDEVKQNMLSGKSNLLVASQIFDIGIDIKTISALILAGSGKSFVKTKQRIGRCLRDGKNKPFAAVVEFYDDVKYLKKHAQTRREIYETEPEFVVKMPKNVK